MSDRALPLVAAVLILAGCAGGDPAGTDPDDRDRDGFGPAAGDCDDHDPAVGPGAEDLPGDGLDSDCNGTDLETTELGDAALLVLRGEAEGDGFGTSVSCIGSSLGAWSSAVAVGADMEGSRPEYERSAGDVNGYVAVYDGSRRGEAAAGDADWRADGGALDELGHRVLLYEDGSSGVRLLATAPLAYRAPPGDPDPEAIRGAAFLFDPSEPGGRVTPEDASTWFAGDWGARLGYGAAIAPDVDGDERPEVLLAELNGGDVPSAARLYASADFTDVVVADDALVHVDAVGRSTNAGRAMTAADVTGDGLVDLVLGEGDEAVPRVSIAPGPPSAWDLASAIRITGPADASIPAPFRSSFGAALDAGDVTGDGTADLSVSDPSLPLTGAALGGVYVFDGPIDSARDVAGAWSTLQGESDHAVLGQAVLVDDLDGDLVEDLVVSAPSDTSMGPERPGLVYVFRGPLPSGAVDPASAWVVFQGVWGDEKVGGGMAACDVDADGTAELVIGAPGDDLDGASGTGRAYLVSLPAP